MQPVKASQCNSFLAKIVSGGTRYEGTKNIPCFTPSHDHRPHVRYETLPEEASRFS